MTAPGRRGLIVFGVLAFCLSVALTFPAHLAARWFLPDHVQAGGLQGTLWRGQASVVATDSLVLGPTQWRVRPLALLWGQLRADLDLNLTDGAVSGQAGLTLGGNLRLRNVTGVVPLAMLGELMGGYDGRLGLDIQSALVTDGWLVDARGTVDVVDLAMRTPFEERLGNFELTFSGAGEDALDGVFQETDAPLDAEGVLRLRADKTWELNGTLTATPDTPARISQGLAYFPAGDQRGQYLVSLSGEL